MFSVVPALQISKLQVVVLPNRCGDDLVRTVVPVSTKVRVPRGLLMVSCVGSCSPHYVEKWLASESRWRFEYRECQEDEEYLKSCSWCWHNRLQWQRNVDLQSSRPHALLAFDMQPVRRDTPDSVRV